MLLVAVFFAAGAEIGATQALLSQDVSALETILAAYPVLNSTEYGWSNTIIQGLCVSSSLPSVTCGSQGAVSFVSHLYVSPVGFNNP